VITDTLENVLVVAKAEERGRVTAEIITEPRPGAPFCRLSAVVLCFLTHTACCPTVPRISDALLSLNVSITRRILETI